MPIIRGNKNVIDLYKNKNQVSSLIQGNTYYYVLDKGNYLEPGTVVSSLTLGANYNDQITLRGITGNYDNIAKGIELKILSHSNLVTSGLIITTKNYVHRVCYPKSFPNDMTSAANSLFYLNDNKDIKYTYIKSPLTGTDNETEDDLGEYALKITLTKKQLQANQKITMNMNGSTISDSYTYGSSHSSGPYTNTHFNITPQSNGVLLIEKNITVGGKNFVFRNAGNVTAI